MVDTPHIIAILNALDSPAILLNRDYRILAANDEYRTLYGFTDQPKQHRCYEVSHGNSVPCDLAGESCPLKDSLQSGEQTEVLHIHHTPRGKEYVNVEMLPLKDPETKEITHFIERIRPSDIASTTTADDGRMVGSSSAFQAMLNLVERVARSDTNVLLSGESGTGKELVAQTVHRLSERQENPFVPVECAGLPDALFESELFGYIKGAFTGATAKKVGLVAAAEGGTLFLDEIGEIPIADQVKLLRLLETRRFREVGSTEWQEANFRLVCATNKNLSEMVEAGSFREDLYYRLNVFEIELPPLRERMEDLPILIETILKRLNHAELTFDSDALGCLQRYHFPGNIRELRNIVERSALLADDGVIHPAHLPKQCQQADQLHPRKPGQEIVSLQEAERRYIEEVAQRYTGPRKDLAKLLGVGERALYRKLAKLRQG